MSNKQKNKFYVVWKGFQPGIYKSWNECKLQIQCYPNAIYKSFQSEEIANMAFNSSPNNYLSESYHENNLSSDKLKIIGKPIIESIAVDGAGDNMKGIIEYQGVYTKTKEVIFKQGPFEGGTNNIAEFLAIIHALAYCKKEGLTLPIYSDSKTALSWVKAKTARTKCEKTEYNKILFNLIERAEYWIRNNTYSNTLLKWETQAWGEIPADFGRK